MEPIPETAEAIDALDDDADVDLRERFVSTSNRVQALVPTCVGMSVSLHQHGITFTLLDSEVAMTAPRVPCAVPERPPLRAVEDPAPRSTEHLPAPGVASSLSLPVLADGKLVGAVKLYGSTRHAFRGHHDALASVVGARVEGAASDDDLSFSTYRSAQQAPQTLRDEAEVDLAIGMLSAVLNLSASEAKDRLSRSAARAGTSRPTLARMISEIVSDRASRLYGLEVSVVPTPS